MGKVPSLTEGTAAMRQSVSKTFSWVQMSVIQHVLMEEMELQSVRSYFRSLQKVSQVKVLFIVQYIMLSSSSPGWTQTSPDSSVQKMDDWVGKHLFSLMGSAKPLDMSPKRRTTTTTKVIYMYIYTQAAPESSSRTPGGRLKKQKHIPPYHPEIHYGSPV